MKSSIQKIINIFKLEIEHGYDNRAVIGGLDKIIENWEAEARVDELPDELINIIRSNLRDYQRISTKSRADVLEGLLHRLQKEYGESKPPITEKTVNFHQVAPIKIEKKTPEISKPDFPQKIEAIEPAQDKQIKPPPLSKPVEQPAELNAPVTVLSGVGPRHSQTLSKLGIHVLRDMLYYVPRRYDDYTQLKPINRLLFGDEVTVIGTIKSVTQHRISDGKTHLVEALLSDGTGVLRLTWFNQPWIVKRLQTGNQYAVSGKINQYLGRLTLHNPEPEPLEQQFLTSNRIVPIYPLTSQITQRWIRKLMGQVVNYWAPRIIDYLPEHLRSSADVIDLPSALLQIHFPDNWEKLRLARKRLAFDEILLLQVGVLRQKYAWQTRAATPFSITDDKLDTLVKGLPYLLTEAQWKAIQAARLDLASGRPMNRLLQGDVGSGKTVVAAIIAATITNEAAQVAFMAPTSILAEQHLSTIKNYLSYKQPNEIRLLLGSTPENEKHEIRQGLSEGCIKIVIGTHALIEEPVQFSNLQLVIIDEQHRFGVEQRALLRGKGYNPHLLVMTATPIPRSLALTIYGDLDLSIIDEMPPGRVEVSTYVLNPGERERAYDLIRKQAAQGNQAFIIYPLIEESEKSEAMAAVVEHARLQKEVFPNLKLGLLHGKLKQEEKDLVMKRFRNGEDNILVSTSVVEVGVDIPNATVIVIEGANRFGLAQLHQFRGRIGRGTEKSYCLLIPENADTIENERLSVMSSTTNGFVLAERDLEQRGPGEFLGTRQSGFAELKFAQLSDLALIENARRHAHLLLDQDPPLQNPENQLLLLELKHFWGRNTSDIS